MCGFESIPIPKEIEMSDALDLTGELIEIGRLENEGGLDGVVIRRPDGSLVTIKGLRMDEVKCMASFLLEQVKLAIAKKESE
jgi:hypothetical protein